MRPYPDEMSYERDSNTVEEQMKNKKLAIALLLTCPASVPAQSESAQTLTRQHRLMPAPAAIRFLAGRLKIDASFTVAIDGHNDGRLEAGVYRASRRLEGRTGLEFARAKAID